MTRPACIATGLPAVGIYIACLASYNAGRLHGAWIDLEDCQNREDLDAAISWIITTSPTPCAEEWAVHDSSGLPGFLARTEWPDLEQLIDWADAISALPDEEDREAFRFACDNQCQILDLDDFRSVYCGHYDSCEDYAQERAEDTGAIPDPAHWPLNCIDWKAAWQELDCEGFWAKRCSSGGVHVFGG